MNKKQISILTLTITALFMAVNIAMSSFSVPVPGGHMYLNDTIIVIASVLLGPLEAFVVGGIGAFIGDFLFYPAPMFVSLVTHGLQAVVISLMSKRLFKDKPEKASIIAAIVGVVINIVGYSLGRAFVYSTPEYAIMKFPFQVLQAAVGSALGLILLWRFSIRKLFIKYIGKNE